jgi:hypothetical protein
MPGVYIESSVHSSMDDVSCRMFVFRIKELESKGNHVDGRVKEREEEYSRK